MRSSMADYYRVSSRGESHPEALAELYVSLAASPCARLSRVPSTTTSESDFALWHLPFSGMIPIVWHTRSVLCTDQDRSGSPRSLDASLSERAVLMTPPQSPATIAICGEPTGACQPLRCCWPADKILNEADPLHFRYGSRVALSTLNPIRYLLRSKTRFPLRRLHARIDITEKSLS